MLANGLQSLAQRLLRGLDAQRPSAQLKPQCPDAGDGIHSAADFRFL
ncbi:MAG: hypothetical protein RLZ81_609 [Pseudomonadota bacterium]|jgi:hypothetical protein